jgi:hypothetical protein
VAALAADRDVLARSGRAFPVAQLAAEYGFTDVDDHADGTPTRTEPGPSPGSG